MKKTVILLLSIVLMLSLASCASLKAPSKMYDAAAYEKYMIPNSVDAVKLAKGDGTMHFWFMSNLGMKVGFTDVNGKEGEPTVQWGDSCLVVFPDGATMLIDCGLDGYAPVLALNLEKLGITRLDYIVVTHPHDDHAGGFYCSESILNNFEVGRVYWSGTYNTGANFSHLGKDAIEKICEQRGIPCSVIHEGDTLQIGEVKVTIINPPKDSLGKGYSTVADINCNSMVMRFDYKEFSALFAGDIHAVQESALVKQYPEIIDADLVKVPHHGRASSSSQEFTNAVSPKLAVCTGNILMDKAIYSNYTRAGSKVLFDYADGYIHVWSDGASDLQYETSRQRKLPAYDLLEYGSPYLI